MKPLTQQLEDKKKETILTKLYEEYLSWEDSIKIRRIARDSAKIYLKEAEDKLKIAKKIFYRTQKDLKYSKVMCEKTKRKYKSFPTKLRNWNKNHMDIVLEFKNGFS